MSRRFEPPGVIGHRGAAALAPENTLPGLAAARAAGCEWIEVDVMLSRDGVPVLHHDHTLHRTAGDDRAVESLSAGELGRVDVGRLFAPRFAGTTVPTLARALACMLDLGLTPNLEVKPAPGLARATTEAMLDVVAAHWPDDRPPPLLSSFNRTCMEVCADKAPDRPRAMIVDAVPDDWRRLLESLGCVALHAGRDDLSVDRVRAVRGGGYFLGVFTVNDATQARTLRRWGVDYVFTDAPDRLIGAMSTAPPAEPG